MTKQKQTPELILASSSPRRLDLLKQIGLTPDKVVSGNIDETALKNELPKDLPGHLAELKAKAVKEKEKSGYAAYILAADTVVACGRRILGKPENRVEAENFLSLLSGRRHRVYGGIALLCPDGRIVSRTVLTMVQFKRLSRDEMDFLLNTGEWEGKAGGYAIQGFSGAFVKSIQGSYTNVVGLSLYDTARILTGNGFHWMQP